MGLESVLRSLCIYCFPVAAKPTSSLGWDFEWLMKDFRRIISSLTSMVRTGSPQHTHSVWIMLTETSYFLFYFSEPTPFFLSRSPDRVRGAKQPSWQVYGDDAVGQGALPFGTGQHAAPRLQDKKHWLVSWAGHLCRCVFVVVVVCLKSI